MRANDPNLPYLRQVAEALGDLRDQVVFVGGAVAGLLVTDPLADGRRANRAPTSRCGDLWSPLEEPGLHERAAGPVGRARACRPRHGTPKGLESVNLHQ